MQGKSCLSCSSGQSIPLVAVCALLTWYEIKGVLSGLEGPL